MLISYIKTTAGFTLSLNINVTHFIKVLYRFKLYCYFIKHFATHLLMLFS